MKIKILVLSIFLGTTAMSYGQTKKTIVKKKPAVDSKMPVIEKVPPSPPPKSSGQPVDRQSYGSMMAVEAHRQVRVNLTDGKSITAKSISELANIDFKTITKFTAENRYTPELEEAEFSAFLERLFNESEYLEELNVPNCKLKALPSIRNINANLKTLDISNNKLTELPEGLEKFVNLTKLVLADNKLAELPESITKLNKLTWISLSGNSFTEFPTEIFEIPSLKIIDLYRNKIIDVPDLFNLLPNLTKFSMQYNRIDSIPPSFATLSKLTEVSLNGNQFKAFPAGVAAVKSLVSVDFSNNPIEKTLFMQSLAAIKWRGLLGLYNLKLTKEEYKAVVAKLKLIEVYYDKL